MTHYSTSPDFGMGSAHACWFWTGMLWRVLLGTQGASFGFNAVMDDYGSLVRVQ